MRRLSLNGASNGGIIVIWEQSGVPTQQADQRAGLDPVVRGGTYGRRGFRWKTSTSLVPSSCRGCNDHRCCGFEAFFIIFFGKENEKNESFCLAIIMIITIIISAVVDFYH